MWGPLHFAIFQALSPLQQIARTDHGQESSSQLTKSLSESECSVLKLKFSCTAYQVNACYIANSVVNTIPFIGCSPGVQLDTSACITSDGSNILSQVFLVNHSSVGSGPGHVSQFSSTTTFSIWSTSSCSPMVSRSSSKSSLVTSIWVASSPSPWSSSFSDVPPSWDKCYPSCTYYVQSFSCT